MGQYSMGRDNFRIAKSYMPAGDVSNLSRVIFMVTISEFSNMDIRIGKVLEVIDLNSRKPMYGLKVDLGELGVRNIAAGIKDRYTKEELVGRKIVMVANLEPKKIGDFTSEGMLLAAEDESNLSLLQPDKDIKEGTRVR